jgi:hypothetical protein
VCPSPEPTSVSTTSRVAMFRADDSSGYDDTSEEEEEEKETSSRRGTGGWSAMLGSPWTWGFGGKVAPVGGTTNTADAHAASASVTPSPDGPEVRLERSIHNAQTPCSRATLPEEQDRRGSRVRRLTPWRHSLSGVTSPRLFRRCE